MNLEFLEHSPALAQLAQCWLLSLQFEASGVLGGVYFFVVVIVVCFVVAGGACAHALQDFLQLFRM